MEHKAKDTSQIKGWGVDADPKNDPTYPMKNRNDGEHAGYSWERPPQQPINVEVLHSNERPDVTSVFGTSTLPSGPSGMIRRFAFRYSESSYGHWLPLMLADRVSVVEGVLGDLTHGHVPNVFAERGWKAEWKHNRTGLVRRTLVKVVLISAAVAYLRSRRLIRTGRNDRRPHYAELNPSILPQITGPDTLGDGLLDWSRCGIEVASREKDGYIVSCQLAADLENDPFRTSHPGDDRNSLLTGLIHGLSPGVA